MYGSVPSALAPALGVPNAPGVVALESGSGKVRRTILKFSNLVVPVVDNPGNGGQVCLKVYDLPLDAVLWKGGVIDLALQVTNTDGSAGVSLTFNGDVGLGTTTGVAGSLATTEQDLVPTTSTPAAVAGATTAKAVSTATEAAKVVAGGIGAKGIFLNQLIDDADQDESSHAATMLLNGSISFNWEVIGNYGTLA